MLEVLGHILLHLRPNSVAGGVEEQEGGLHTFSIAKLVLLEGESSPVRLR